ncbi:PQQ-binding-like beta-propeller repeat protein [Streptomyces sp. NBC_00376]|uniref:outer membrane protein assembly factor BamB family protein n=1 Tax=unclassified Streptomyces TaxID=2593676 RepID=UPI002E1FBD0F
MDASREWLPARTTRGGRVQEALVPRGPGQGHGPRHGRRQGEVDVPGPGRWTGERTPAVLAGDTVYVGGGDRLVYALNAAGGKRKWAAGDREGTIPAVADGRVYVAVREEFSPTVLALDAKDGSEVWSASSSERVGLTADGNHPIVHGRLVYVATSAQLLAFDAATGTHPT